MRKLTLPNHTEFQNACKLIEDAQRNHDPYLIERMCSLAQLEGTKLQLRYLRTIAQLLSKVAK